MKCRKITALLMAFVMLITLLPSKSEAAKKVSLNKKRINLTVGKTYKLKVRKIKKSIKVKWSSNRKRVAIVSKNGTVKAKSPGKAKITAKIKSLRKKFTCTVTVNKKKAKATVKPVITKEPAKSDMFVMDHKVRQGFIVEKKEIIDTSSYITISSVDDLKKIKKDADASYVLINDLDMSGTSWSPVSFDGYFEGNHHVIKGLNNTLFKTLCGTVKNVGFENVNVENAAIAEVMTGGSIENCYVTGKVNGSAGLVGKVSNQYNNSTGNVYLYYCYNTAEIVNDDITRGNIGGIIGTIDIAMGPVRMDVYNCENYGSIYAKGNVGGIIGRIERGSNLSGYYDSSIVSLNVRNCYNYGDVQSKNSVSGGVIGSFDVVNASNKFYNFYNISCCANYGNVISGKNNTTGTAEKCGGICGQLELEMDDNGYKLLECKINDCLNTGNIVKGDMSGGGICGAIHLNNVTCTIKKCITIGNADDIYGSFASKNPNWSSNKIIQEDCYSERDYSIAEMKDISNNLQSFMYPDVWGINELYCGFPHPYGIDENDSVQDYYNAIKEK